MAIRIDAESIVTAMTSSDDLRWSLDIETGSVEPSFFDEDEGDEDGEEALATGLRVHVPTIETRKAFRIMQDFAAEVQDAEVRDVLETALEGKGAFRRFRDAVRRWPDIDNAWHLFHRDAILAMARRWLEDEGIEAILEVAPMPDPPPVGEGRHKVDVPRIGLLEMLLLGAPDGKTELLDGRVHRVFVAKTTKEARKVFADVARDIHERAGLGWRKSYIEGKSSVQVDRYELDVEDLAVELAVALEPGLWARFAR